ncbi:MAG: LytTR family DNA-binding domain-containing protein [Flavobacteriales bacterium]|nr:LytTR family DNA-binding domain-containing protein [Flavobacteriales bacterium]
MVQCLIIDDEKNARENLENLVSRHCPELRVVSMATSGLEGIQKIKELKPDAIFLDVHMNDIDGFTLLSRLEEPKPMVVFVTAYEKYALRAIKASAIDYILKPVSIRELQNASQKLEQLHKLKHENPAFERDYSDALKLMIQSSHDENPERIALPDHSGYRFENMRDIVRMESDSNYTTIFLKNHEKVVVSKPMKHFEDFLDENTFIRIHNSHIINILFLKSYLRDEGGMAELIDGTRLQIAKRRLPLFLDTIKNRFIKP